MTEVLLARVEVKNFKSIRNVSLDLRPFTVIVGENSAGKSSLLQAIFLLAQISRERNSPALASLNGMELKLGDFKDVVYGGDVAESIELALTIPSGAPVMRRSPRGLGLAWRSGRRRSAQHRGDEATWRLTLEAPEAELGTARIREIHIAHVRAGLDLSLTPSSSQRETAQMYEHARRLGLVRGFATGRAQLLSEVDAVTAFEGQLRVAAPSDLAEETDEVFPAALVENGLPVALFAVKSESESLAETWIQQVRRRTEMEMARTGRRRMGVQEPFELGLTLPRATEAAERLFVDFRRWVHDLDRMLDPELPRGAVSPLPEELYAAIAEAERTIIAELSRLLDETRPERPAVAPHPSATLEIAAEIRALLYNSVHYLGPLREDPSPSYRPGQRGGVATLGLKGEFTIAILNTNRAQETECPLEEGGTESMTLEAAVDYWARRFKVADRVRTIHMGRPGIQVELTDPQTGASRDPTSVGVGVSQILPVIVLCLIAQPGDLVMIEQPELHLHPAPQQVLGDFLLRVAESGRQLIVETHSEYLINRLRLRVAADEFDTVGDLVNMWYARRDGGLTRFELLKPNRFGTFDDWPDGFFDQAPREAEEILRAAARKRRRGQAAVQAEPSGGAVAVAIHAEYYGQRTEGSFDPRTEAVTLFSEPFSGRTFPSPSGAAIEVVRRLNPDVSPNRNGWRFWVVTATGQPLESLRRS